MSEITSENNTDTITVTPFAAENIKQLQVEYEALGFGLRFGITGGGCSGYKYIIELENEPDETDLIFSILSAVLELGNVDFVGGDGNASIADHSKVSYNFSTFTHYT